MAARSRRAGRIRPDDAATPDAGSGDCAAGRAGGEDAFLQTIRIKK